MNNEIWANYPELQNSLKQVQKTMKSSISVTNPDIKAAIFDLFDGGGKMLRPIYLLLFSDFTKISKKQKIALAAAIEMLHTATLIHDDVIDKADTRRGVQTLSSKYSAEVAVYAGDYLFVAVFKLLAHHSFKIGNLTKNIDSMDRLLGGELGQLNNHFDFEQTMDSYISNISGKTGELFAMACSIAPIVAGNNSLANRAYKIGMSIGIAFQVMDDYLDYAATSQTLGKPVLEDIKQGIFSAPVLFAIEENKEQMVTWIKNKEFEQVYDYITNSNALEKTKELANFHTTKAIDLINKLPKGKNKELILSITSELLERKL